MKTTARWVLAAFLLVSASFIGEPTALADSFGSGTNQFEIEFVSIGNPNNPGDSTGNPNPSGKVEYGYRIGKLEISEDMINDANALGGLGITHDNRGANSPATSVSWIEAAKFVNWLAISRGHQPTYKFDANGNFQLWSSAEAWQKGGEKLFRHKDAFYFLPSNDEWYKAAYYNSSAAVYYDFPTGSDVMPDGIDFVGDPTFDAVFTDGATNLQPNDVTNAGVSSPYGTAGQAGNVWEWTETEFDLVNNSTFSDRGIRGGSWSGAASAQIRAADWYPLNPSIHAVDVGLRVASIPEPNSMTIVALAAGRLFVRRKR